MIEVPKKTTLVRYKELSYVTFLFLTESDSVYSISLPSKDDRIRNFEAILEDYVQIVDFYTLAPDSELRQKIALTCPMGANAQELGSNNDDNLEGVG